MLKCLAHHSAKHVEFIQSKQVKWKDFIGFISLTNALKRLQKLCGNTKLCRITYQNPEHKHIYLTKFKTIRKQC